MTPLQNCIHSNPHLIKYNRPYHGYVYFISDGDAVKVGLSRSTAMIRIGTLQVGNPRQLRMIAALPTDEPEDLEDLIHKALQDRLIRGEWYRLQPDDLNWIHANFSPLKLPAFAVAACTSGKAYAWFGSSNQMAPSFTLTDI